jgi:hypothetical protein
MRVTAPDQQNPDPEPNAGQDAEPREQGIPTPGQAEGDDDVNPPQPGSPRG